MVVHTREGKGRHNDGARTSADASPSPHEHDKAKFQLSIDFSRSVGRINPSTRKKKTRQSLHLLEPPTQPPSEGRAKMAIRWAPPTSGNGSHKEPLPPPLPLGGPKRRYAELHPTTAVDRMANRFHHPPATTADDSRRQRDYYLYQ